MANERAIYRARESSVGGVTALWQVREQIQGKGKFIGRSHSHMASERADTGQGKVQWEESQTYGQ